RKLLEKKPEDEAQRCLEKIQAGNLDLLFQLLLSAQVNDQALVERLPEKEVATLLLQLDSYAATLRKRAPLQLPPIRFCRKIKAFGVFDPLPENPCFEAGPRGLPGESVLVYVEVRNFASRDLGQQRFKTALTPRLEIYECRL